MINFADHQLLPLLFGEFDRNLSRIEQSLGVQLSSRGNKIVVSGSPQAVQFAEIAVIWAGQTDYLRALADGQMVFGLGPAGTGKTYLAVAMAVNMLISGRVDRIILSRPAVEAGERLGFLPGDLRDKIDPYLAPLYDALYDMLPADQALNRLNSGEIEVAPLAFMRGRTLSHAFVILDEAQNATRVQMKMFLTRLGEGSLMAITGDPSQVDLPTGSIPGLSHAANTLKHIDGVHVVKFSDADVVRHSLVTRVVQAYEKDERRKQSLPKRSD